jgi:large subunit ribosomal protein L4e
LGRCIAHNQQQTAMAAAAAARPVVSVYSHDTKTESKVVEQTKLPAVFLAPIRNDVVRIVHTNVAKNKRQPYGVNRLAGHKYSAESWGTGRAVARIPRVSGGGTHRSGQGAFGNMCRGGRMFAPTKVFRRWHRHVNKNMRRYAVTSALAASGLPALVLARGHKIESVPEIPLVVDDGIEKLEKTKDAVALLKNIGALDDVSKVATTRTRSTGRRKWRNRTYVMKRGPMVVFADAVLKQAGRRAFKNLPGVTCANVNFLNVLQLAPGGHLGRFIVWAKSAFNRLDQIFGTFDSPSKQKRDYFLPRPMLTSTDVARVINSQEVQAAVRPKQLKLRRGGIKYNPLRNHKVRQALNPLFNDIAGTNKATEKQSVSSKRDVRKLRNSFVNKRKASLKKQKETPKTSAPAQKKAKKVASPAAKAAQKK